MGSTSRRAQGQRAADTIVPRSVDAALRTTVLGIRAAAPRSPACLAELTERGGLPHPRDHQMIAVWQSKGRISADLLFEQWNKHGVARFRSQRAPVFFDRRSS